MKNIKINVNCDEKLNVDVEQLTETTYKYQCYYGNINGNYSYVLFTGIKQQLIEQITNEVFEVYNVTIYERVRLLDFLIVDV